jgi:plastocyanin
VNGRAAFVALTLLAACDDARVERVPASKADANPTFESSVTLAADPAAPAGELRGVVRFVGEPPARRPLAVSGASGCGGAAPLSDTLIVTGGGVANVLVHARSGLAADAIAPPSTTPLVLDQENCIYAPHVVALRAGQLLEIRSADGVTHNVNAKPQRNERFNLSQTPGSPPIEARFERGELSIPLSCDIHPWMSAQVHVLEHQAFALSAADGSFAIRGLAPGRYRFEALHEALGELEFEVELDARVGASVSIEFRRAQAAAR